MEIAIYLAFLSISSLSSAINVSCFKNSLSSNISFSFSAFRFYKYCKHAAHRKEGTMYTNENNKVTIEKSASKYMQIDVKSSMIIRNRA